MKKITISIHKPCSEDFNTFVKKDEGGFCNACKKTVVDFTKMSDHEILAYFSSEKSKTCGLFLESQLKSYSNLSSTVSKPNSSTFVSSIFGVSLLSILSFTNGFSQDKTNTNEVLKIENGSTKQDVNSADLNQEFTVSGIVSDTNGPLPGANIYLKNHTIGTQTDIDGKFTFPKQLKTGDVLIVSFIGYEDREIKVTSKNQSFAVHYDVKLNDFKTVMLGEVSTNKVYTSKRTFIHRVKSLFTNE